MKKDDIRELKEITLSGSYTVPENWAIIKDVTKMCENGVDVFKIVIGKKG
jgi:collagenase-like PrtC family protease